MKQGLFCFIGRKIWGMSSTMSQINIVWVYWLGIRLPQLIQDQHLNCYKQLAKMKLRAFCAKSFGPNLGVQKYNSTFSNSGFFKLYFLVSTIYPQFFLFFFLHEPTMWKKWNLPRQKNRVLTCYTNGQRCYYEEQELLFQNCLIAHLETTKLHLHTRNHTHNLWTSLRAVKYWLTLYKYKCKSVLNVVGVLHCLNDAKSVFPFCDVIKDLGRNSLDLVKTYIIVNRKCNIFLNICCVGWIQFGHG